MIPWLDHSSNVFPSPDRALREPNGLLCAGGDLTPGRILTAYRQGIFPWFSAGEPVLWWSPDPRMVLEPAQLKISRSLRRTLRRAQYEVRLDSCFPTVIRACAEITRKAQGGTWITRDMQAAYIRLHRAGYAHSVETWMEGQLMGGLYGIAIGKMFYGESMFSLVSDTSKIALAHLARYLARQGFGLIDCQMTTPHLASLGAHEIPRSEFIERLRTLTAEDSHHERWPVNAASQPW